MLQGIELKICFTGARYILLNSGLTFLFVIFQSDIYLDSTLACRNSFEDAIYCLTPKECIVGVFYMQQISP